MVRFSTNFSENKIQNGIPTGWTQRIQAGGSGQKAKIISSPLNPNSNALHLDTGSSGGSFVISYDSLDNYIDVETLTTFRIIDIAQVGRFGINYNRYSGNSEASTKGYNVSFTQVSSNLSVIISEDSVGSILWKNYPWSLNTWYNMRFRTVKNRISAKIWPHSTAEPKEWSLDSQTVSPEILSPYSGVGTFVQLSAIEYDYFSAGIDTDIAFLPGETIHNHSAGLRKIKPQDISHEQTANYTEGRTDSLTGIVLHWWDEPSINPTMAGVISHFKNPNSEVSAHFVVSGNSITQLVNIEDTAWHCRGNNAYTIGIEIDPNLPTGTYQTVASLIDYLKKITGKSLFVKGHNEMPGNSTTACPGLVSRAFIEELSTIIPSEKNMGVRAYSGTEFEYRNLKTWDGSKWLKRKTRTWDGYDWV